MIPGIAGQKGIERRGPNVWRMMSENVACLALTQRQRHTASPCSTKPGDANPIEWNTDSTLISKRIDMGPYVYINQTYHSRPSAHIYIPMMLGVGKYKLALRTSFSMWSLLCDRLNGSDIRGDRDPGVSHTVSCLPLPQILIRHVVIYLLARVGILCKIKGN